MGDVYLTSFCFCIYSLGQMLCANLMENYFSKYFLICALWFSFIGVCIFCSIDLNSINLSSASECFLYFFGLFLTGFGEISAGLHTILILECGKAQCSEFERES